MRTIYFLALLFLLAAVGLFAVQNSELITLRYFNQSISCPPALLAAVVYLLGMVSGWAVVGFVRRSLQRVANHPTA